MDIALFSFATLALFMIHEFEEIIRFHTWAKTKKFPNTRLFAHLHAAYTSTETVAIMIAEEFIIITLILGYAILTNTPAIAIATAVALTIHLVGHLIAAIVTRKWLPGSGTALVTGLGFVAIIAIAMQSTATSASSLIPYVLAIGGLLVANLVLLHANARHIERWRR